MLEVDFLMVIKFFHQKYFMPNKPLKKINILIKMNTISDIKPTFDSGDSSFFPKITDLEIADFCLDKNYKPIRLENSYKRESAGFGRQETTDSYIIRGHVKNEEQLKTFINKNKDNANIIGIFSDPYIACFSCTSSFNTPIGDHNEVMNLLNIPQLHLQKMDGSNVFVAIVDTGINLNHLKSRGKKPKLNKNHSFPNTNLFSQIFEWLRTLFRLGSASVDHHGTMCAFNVLNIAPHCTLLDHSIIGELDTEPKMLGLLSDAIQSYDVLLKLRKKQNNSPKQWALVVNNSWGMYNPNWDYPVGDILNYSNDPTHPFNLIVEKLEGEGVDILFAAGNCGEENPDYRCEDFTDNTIYGANSHPNILSIAAVNVNKERLGYSSKGPGRLEDKKPDLCAYSHFEGSRPPAPDGGTSTACAVATGVVAAIRSKYPPSVLSPAQLRQLLRETAEKLVQNDFDYSHGYGLINVDNLLEALDEIQS